MRWEVVEQEEPQRAVVEARLGVVVVEAHKPVEEAHLGVGLPEVRKLDSDVERSKDG